MTRFDYSPTADEQEASNALPSAVPTEFDSPEYQAKLDALYRDFEHVGMTPLWTTREGLMPMHPEPRAIAHRWGWSELIALAARSADLVPVGRGGERRAISLGNPGLPGDPYTTPTLWAAIQYLAPRESAPEHRHSQSAFRFVLEGEGVWTVVDGDPVAMRRGDLLLTPGWHFHGHQNVSDEPMAWLDGLDIPLVLGLDQGFFEFGPETVRNRATPSRSYSERLWGQPGLAPVRLAGSRASSPLMAYRWSHTDAALQAQLELEADGAVRATVSPGHAAVRFTNPTNGEDALTTIRIEMHRISAGTTTGPERTSASAVVQVFQGSGSIAIGEQRFNVGRGDVVAMPSWARVEVTADEQLDLFKFSDAPTMAKLGLLRTVTAG
jgi:gentisate 1,2-dioxygenase